VAPRKVVVAVALITLLPPAASPARAWIFPEHRKITSTAITGLREEQAEILRGLWESARAGREGRFCPEPDAPEPEATPACLDYSTWPAIGGDHACSFEEMLATVSDTDWILKVAAIGARTGRDLAAATDERQMNSAYVRYTLNLARTDPTPGVRGVGNNGHFALNRRSNDLQEYLESAVRDGAPLNSLGIYARNHLAALRLAAAWGAGGLAPEEMADLARAALAREAFGLHFLEDSFAAGHVAGCWGRGPERLGTHDYYNEHGLETMTWAGENVILLGDRRMRPEDLERAASAVRASFAQLLEATRPGSALSAGVSSLSLDVARERPPFDVCKGSVFPEGEVPGSLYPALQEVAARTPMPARGPGIGSLPRNRAEVGAFISWVSGARVGVLKGQFDRSLNGTYLDGEVFLGLRGGVGLDALTGRTGDGLMFLEIGVANRQEKGPYFSGEPPVENLPGRTGVQFRLRSPFYLIPGDLLIAAPVLALASPQKLKTMAIVAANGGLIPWQRPMPLGERGRLQFVLGREIGVTLHGRWGADHYMMPTRASLLSAPEMREVEVRTTEWEFPILEYRAFRAFAGRQSYTAILQLGAGFDKVIGADVVGEPDVPAPDLRTRNFVFMRMTFDVRHYF
jgi:hypothetical protein